MSILRPGRALGLLAMVAALAGSAARCNCAVDLGFECGKPLDADPDAIRRCGADHEACICATNSCARRDDACAAGYRYVDPPFARRCRDGTDDCVGQGGAGGAMDADAGTATERVAGECVPAALVGWRIDPGADQPRCGDQADGGTTSASSSGSSAASSSSGEGTTSSSGTGTPGTGGAAGGKP